MAIHSTEAKKGAQMKLFVASLLIFYVSIQFIAFFGGLVETHKYCRREMSQFYFRQSCLNIDRKNRWSYIIPGHTWGVKAGLWLDEEVQP